MDVLAFIYGKINYFLLNAGEYYESFSGVARRRFLISALTKLFDAAIIFTRMT
jgi:hypothetical protein